MEELAKLLTNYAFPVVVSLYLLTRLEKRMGALEDTLNELSKNISDMCNEMKEMYVRKYRR
jgi:hypothetical protein